MKTIRLVAFAGVLSAVALQGCTNKSSSTGGAGGNPVSTSDMHFHAQVEAYDTTTASVSVYLDDGRLFGSQYRLDGGDYLRTCVAAQCKNLRDDYTVLDSLFPFFPTGYSNSTTYLAETDYVISLNRPSGSNAPSSRVQLPQPFDIYAPAANQQVTDGDTVQIGWLPTGAGDLVDVSTQLDCTHLDGLHTKSSGPRVPDVDGNGIESIRINDAIADARRNAISPLPIHHCDITFVVAHERPGTIDPAYRRGQITGIVARQVRARYIPR